MHGPEKSDLAIAATVGITKRKVNTILDADIR